ncbi:MAG: hypothetical protein JW751_20015 [Polyangiaceae bacterium]|nr:hypothetical protein [Polyangiaceae bacterium]
MQEQPPKTGYTILAAIAAYARAAGAGAVAVAGAVLFARIVDEHYPIRDWFIWTLLPIWAYVGLFAASTFSFGAGVLRWTTGPRRAPLAEWVIHSLTVGIVAFVWGLYLLGATGFLVGWAALVLPLGMLMVSAPTIRATYRDFDRGWRGGPSRPLLQRILIAAAVAWGIVWLFLVYLEALSPSSINFDASWYHLPIAQDYARIGRIVPFPGEGHRAYPHLTSMVQTWALLVPGLATPERWMLILNLEFFIVVGRIIGVAAVAAFVLDDREVPALWVVFFLFPTVFVYDQNIGGSADHYVGFFAAPVFLAAARSLSAFEPRHCVQTGVALAGAILTKYQAAYLAAAVAVVLTVTWAWQVGKRVAGRRFSAGRGGILPGRRLVLAPILVVAATGLVSAPHLVKNTVFYGNPTYPLLQKYFPGTHPRILPSEKKGTVAGGFSPRGQGLARQVWIGQRILDHSIVTGNRDLTKHRPYMGSLFTLLLPVLPFVRRPRRALIAAAVSLLAFYVWAATAANDRYTLAFMTVPIGLTAALLVRGWELGWLARVGLSVVVGVQFLWSVDAPFVHGDRRLAAGVALLRAGHRGKVDDERLGERATARAITDATPPDARILARNYRSLLGLDRLVYSDVEAVQGAIRYRGLKNANGLYAQCVREGITHLIYPEGQRRPHSWNNTILFAELARHGRRLMKSGGVVLVELGREPPPATAPYLVLVRGLSEYSDGLYPVEALDIVDQVPRANRPDRNPLQALTAANAQELVGRASAIASTRDLPGGAQSRVERDFERFERFGSASVYLRRRR